MKTAHILKFKLARPRCNLPAVSRHKRGESNFVKAFSNAYIASCAPHGIGGNEFGLSGYGIADFVWVSWQHRKGQGASALSGEKLRSGLNKRRLVAFEMKLADYRGGLAQAYRYSYFADLAVVVVPARLAPIPPREFATYKILQIGLWTFDQGTGIIEQLFTPRTPKPRNAAAKAKALDLLCQFFELRQSAK
jgi:hypothetical protein